MSLIETLATISTSPIEHNAPLAPYTSLRIGGPADYLVAVNQVVDMVAIMSALYDHDEPFLVLGGGSNVLVSDVGVRGMVLINQCRKVDWSHVEEGHVTAESGVLLAGLARASIKHRLAGLAWAVSVPGTVGGAVVGNAGAHGGSMADNLTSIELWHEGSRETVPADDLALAYRSSRLKASVSQPGLGPVILSATFSLARDEKGQELALAEQFIRHRRRTQPVVKSAGSIFRNPEGDFAGRLIDAAGLKGTALGGARISDVHANFITNPGTATAADVMRLMDRVRLTVFQEFGIILQPEIQIIGDWQDQPQLTPLP